jgi:hypothetical protein
LKIFTLFFFLILSSSIFSQTTLCSSDQTKQFNMFIDDLKLLAQGKADKAAIDIKTCEYNAQNYIVKRLGEIQKDLILFENYCGKAVAFCNSKKLAADKIKVENSNDKNNDKNKEEKVKEEFEFFFFDCRPTISFNLETSECKYFNIETSK